MSKDSDRYGRWLGPFFWHYNLTLGAKFNQDVLGMTLRYWGFVFNHWAIGIMRREKDTPK